MRGLLEGPDRGCSPHQTAYHCAVRWEKAKTSDRTMHPVDLLAPVSPISWDNIPLRRIQTPTRAGRDGKRLNSTVYGYTFLLATPIWILPV